MPNTHDTLSTFIAVSSNVCQKPSASRAGPVIHTHHEYVGQRVGKKKHFDGIVYYGTVTKYNPEEQNPGNCWSVFLMCFGL
jgi:hypothetical protein